MKKRVNDPKVAVKSTGLTIKGGKKVEIFPNTHVGFIKEVWLRQRAAYENMHDYVLYHREITQKIAQVLKPHDLDARQWVVLGLISKESGTDGCRVTDLASAMQVKTTYITAIVGHLKSLNLIGPVEQKPTDDQRERRVAISPVGARLLGDIETEVQNLEEEK